MPRPKSEIEQMWGSENDGQPQGKCKWLFNADQEPFWVFVVEDGFQRSPARVASGRPLDRHRVSYPIARLCPNGIKTMIPWTVEALVNFMQRTLREYRNLYHREYVLKIEPAKKTTAPLDYRKGHRAPIPKMQSVPDLPPRKTTASREDLNRLSAEPEPAEADFGWES